MEKLTQFMAIIRKQFQSFMQNQLKDFDITSAEAQFIKFLSENPNCRQIDFSKQLECDKAHSHRIVTKLVDKKIIKPLQANQQLELTQKGLSMVDAINKTLNLWKESLCEGITKEEGEIALSIMQKCVDNACNINMEKKDV